MPVLNELELAEGLTTLHGTSGYYFTDNNFVTMLFAITKQNSAAFTPCTRIQLCRAFPASIEAAPFCCAGLYSGNTTNPGGILGESAICFLNPDGWLYAVLKPSNAGLIVGQISYYAERN